MAGHIQNIIPTILVAHVVYLECGRLEHHTNKLFLTRTTLIMEKKISIITVCYNCKEAIINTLNSVKSLSYSNLEYIVIDGGSTDGTKDIIEQYKDCVNYFVSERDRGIYDAMNKGIMAATGEWLIFMNAGDFFTNRNTIGEFMRFVDDDTVVAYGDIIRQRKGYYYLDKPAGVTKTSEKMPVFHQASFIKASYHKQHLFDSSFRSSGDYNFFYNCFLHDHCKFQYIPVAVACFDDSEGMSKDNHALSLRENLRIWGREHDYLYCLKQEYQLKVFSIVMWIKRNLLSKNDSMQVEIRRLRKEGKQCVEGYYTSK